MSDPPEDADGSGSDPDATAVPDDDAPLADLARRMGRERSGDDRESADLDADLSEGPPPDPDEDPFDRMSVGEVDEEALWSSLGAEELGGIGPDAGVDANTGVTADATTAANTDVDSPGENAAAGPGSPDGTAPVGREEIVPKSDYCQSCPYLDSPPELACTHEGTEIVEVVDTEQFRVRNCPMVDGDGDGVDVEE